MGEEVCSEPAFDVASDIRLSGDEVAGREVTAVLWDDGGAVCSEVLAALLADLETGRRGITMTGFVG